MEVFHGYVGSTVPILLTASNGAYVLCQDQKSNFTFMDTIQLVSGNVNYEPSYFYVSTEADKFDSKNNKTTVKFKNTINSLGFSNGSVEVSALPANFVLSGSTYTFWDPYSVLAGTTYHLSYSGSDVNIPMTDGTTSKGTTSNIQIIPIQWYYNCTSDTFTPNINEVTDSNITTFGIPNTLSQISCNLPNGNTTSCNKIMWTDSKYCIKANALPYCSGTSFCGSSCMGPCAKSEDVCLAVDQTSSKCTFSPSNMFKGQWWKDTWFIIACSVAAFILLIIIIFIINGVIKSNKTKAKRQELFEQEKAAALQALKENVKTKLK